MAPGEDTANILAAYGMLRPDAAQTAPAHIMSKLSPVGTGKIAGQLIDLGGYPGLTPGNGEVICALLRLAGADGWRALDAFEDYNPDDPQRSMYIRRPTLLLGQGMAVQAYWWNRSPTAGPVITSGDWIKR